MPHQRMTFMKAPMFRMTYPNPTDLVPGYTSCELDVQCLSKFKMEFPDSSSDKHKKNTRHSTEEIRQRFLRMFSFTCVGVVYSILRTAMVMLQIHATVSNPYIGEVNKAMQLEVNTCEEGATRRKNELCNYHPILIGEFLEVITNWNLDPVDVVLALDYVVHHRNLALLRRLHTSEWFQPQMVWVPMPRTIEYNLHILQRYMSEEEPDYYQPPDSEDDDPNDQKRE